MQALLICILILFITGVFFRKYTEKQAKLLSLRGWCMNTSEGTVKGQLEGPQNELNEMLVILMKLWLHSVNFYLFLCIFRKHWLQNKGSPSSRIDKAVFAEMIPIKDYNYQNFSVRR